MPRNKIDNIEDLSKHEFVVSQLKSMKKIYSKTGLYKNNKIDKRKLTKKDKRLFDIFSYSTEALHKANQLNYSVAFISSYPATLLWKKYFNRVDYIEFHMQAYLANVIGLYDRCLLIVNCLFNLGLRDKDVNHRQISNNLHLDKTKTKKILEEIYRGIEHIRSNRNYCTHIGRFDDKQLSNIHTLELIKEYDKKKNLKGILRISYQFYKSKQLKIIRDNNKIISSALDALFRELHTERLRRT